MSNQRLPNEEDIQRVSDVEESVDLHTVQGLQEEYQLPLPYQQTRKKKMQRMW